MRDGEWIYYTPEGNETKGVYVDGKPTGKFVELYESGKEWKVYSYKDGKLDGRVVEYYESGKTLSYGSYQDGELRGLWQEYYESGPTKTEGNYQQGGVKFGMWLSYYEDKSKHREDGYMYGKRHGHLKVYGLDGSLLDMDLYENGVCTAECEADD